MKLVSKWIVVPLALAIVVSSWSPIWSDSAYASGFDGKVEAVNETFNAMATGQTPVGFTVSEGGGTVRVAEVPNALDKSVYLDDTSTSTNVIMSTSIEPLAGQVTVEMDFMMQAYVSSTKVIRLKGSGGTPIILETKSNSVTYRHADNTYEPIAAVTANEWIRLKMIADTDTDTADIYVNGELKIDGAPFYSPSNTVDFMESFTPNSSTGSHYLDNIVIAGYPEGYVPPVVVVESDFNNEAIGELPVGYSASEAGGTVRIAAVPDETNRSVYLDDTSDSTNVILSKSFDPLASEITLQLKFMQPTYTSSTKVVRLKGDGKTSVVLETNGGFMNYRHADNTFEPLVTVAAGVWYDIAVVADVTSQTADVYVDGALKLENAPFQQAADRVDYFETFTPNSKMIGHYVDDIIIAGTPYVATEDPGTGGGGEQPSEPPVNGIYEAEDAILSAAIIDNKHPGYTGTGFVDFNPNAPGGWIEWTVSLPAAGEYTLEYRYASGAAEDRPAEIAVNGVVAAPQLGFPSTGDFAQWQTASFKTTLLAGANVIRATATGPSGGANIDHLRIHDGSDTEGPPPVAMEEVEVTDIIGGLLLKKLDAIGMLAGERSADRVITRIEFMSQMNDTLGLVHDDKFQGLSSQTAIWEKSLDEWDAYVLQAAKSAGYVAEDDNAEARPHESLTRKAAADMIARALSLTDSNGSIGAVVRHGYMSGKGGFGEKAMVTSAEAHEIIARIAAETQGSPEVRIVGAHAVASNIVAVTLNARLAEVDYKDLTLSYPTGSWKSLTPAFKGLQLKKGAKGTNTFGNTVVFFETVEQLGNGATFAHEKKPGSFTGDLAQAIQQANNLVSWQMDHGGWTKAMPYNRPWNTIEKKSSQFGPTGIELGTIDNNATINEIRFISQVYQETNDAAYKESIRRGIDFILDMQYDTGAWPQVYPERGSPGDGVYYSNYATFNDNAMINVLELIDDIVNQAYPFDSAIVDNATVEALMQAKSLGIEYILRSQIEVDGVLTAWCAQHDPYTYEPRSARAYEHPSISGSESVGIVRYLAAQPNQTEEIQRAVMGALEWFDSVKLEGIRYVSADPNGVYFVEDPSAVSWYRFYEIGTNKGIFSGRDGMIKYSIQEIEQERRDGYSWGGSYARQLLETMKMTGYFVNGVYALAENTNSVTTDGRTLKSGDMERVGDLRSQLSAMTNHLTVAQDGSKDYVTVQAAIDAVQANNTEPVEISILNGIYKEVVTIPANKPFITLVGESAEGTVLTYDNYAGLERPIGGTYGTSGSASVFVNGNDFTARNLTIENSFDESSVNVQNKQAVALNVRGDRHRFINVRFLGNQDTLLTNGGTQYFYQCYIEGDVDFIFGGSRAVFEESVIHSLDRGSSSNNGYITAASTMITEPFGYLFLNSKLTSDAASGTVWLGRPWHPSGNPNAIASVLFMNTEMGAHINPIGWTDMSGFLAKDARFAEYQNYGPGAIITDTRPQLTDEEAAQWTIENVLKGLNPKGE
ncbi:pectate lyase [Cohnella sp.]|uniref:pectate lyase n=1 Tax=Cohnella sp. TaxID=1883426 RepID=UPI00356AB57B